MLDKILDMVQEKELLASFESVRAWLQDGNKTTCRTCHTVIGKNTDGSIYGPSNKAAIRSCRVFNKVRPGIYRRISEGIGCMIMETGEQKPIIEHGNIE